jgi:cell division protein FtsI (penicillin-binding protein 3)
MAEKNVRGQFSKAVYVYYTLLLIAIFIVVKILILIVREELADDNKKLKVQVTKLLEKEIVIKANRGSIISNDGELLAVSAPVFNIGIDLSPMNVSDESFDTHHDSLAYYLAKHFPQRTKSQYVKIFKEIRKDSIQYKHLFSNIEYKELQLLRSFPLFRIGQFGGGLIAKVDHKRVKPYGVLASRLIGHYREHSKIGIESAYNDYLSGTDGRRLEKRIGRGRYVPKNEDYIVPPKEGFDVVTTIDTRIQQVAHNSLKKQLKNQDAEWGCAIVMDVKTGEIRAMVNLKKSSDSTYNEAVNFAISELYEPGSSFKLFSMMIMLDDNNLDLDEIVHTGSGAVTICKRTIRDVYPLGSITAREVFEKSSNVGTVELVVKRYENNPMKFVNRLLSAKLTRKLGIDIIGEKPAKISFQQKYKGCEAKVSLASLSYGYGVSITPLQLLAYYNAIANNGKLMRPIFVTEIKNGEQTVHKFSPITLHHRMCKPETAILLQELLAGVVENGTAKNLQNMSCRVGGKTATARIYDVNTKEYSQKDYNASFVGFFPVENPKYSCIVVVNKPRKSIYGGSVAAPIFKEIVDIIYATNPDMYNDNKVDIQLEENVYPLIHKTKRSSLEMLASMLVEDVSVLNIPQYEWITYSEQPEPEFKRELFDRGLVPDVRMMNVKDAVFLLEDAGFSVSISGKGKVFQQSVLPNTNLNEIEKKHIHLTLKTR